MKIPTGNFGQVVAAPKQAARISADTAVGEALQRAGGQVAGAAIDQIAANTRENERQKDLSERTAAAKARTTTINDLADLQDEFNRGIADGTIDKAKAPEEWQARTKSMLDGRLEGLSPDFAGQLGVEFDGLTRRGMNGVRDAVSKRNQQDTHANLMGLGEQYERTATRDPARATAEYFAQVDTLGPQAGLAPDQIQQMKQSFTEKTTFTRGFTLVNAAKRSNAALDKVEQQLNSDEFAGMDPQRKAQMLTTLEGYKVSNIQKAEAEARRRQAESERYLRKAEHEFTAANSIITGGKQLSPEYVQQVSAAVAGTPYALAFKESLKQGPASAAFGTQPLAVQQRALIEARNQLNTKGTTPEAEKRVAQLQKIYDQSAKDYAEDPLLAAQERGVIQQVAPLDMRDLNTVVAGLGQRVNQATITRQQVGQPVSPLLKSEAEQIGKMINVLPMEQRSSAIASIATAVGPEQAAALGRQMAPKDKALGIALGMAGSKTTEGRYTAEIVLRGSQAIKDKAVKEDNIALTGIRARVAAEIGNAYQNEEQRQTMIDAAVMAEYGLQSEGSGSLSRAVKLVTGGIVERGGAKVPLPYGMTADQFDQRLRKLSPVDLKTATVVVDGQKLSAYDFLAKVPDAALIHAGQGRYAVQAGTGIAQREDGRPLIIEVK
jgi:hypothetical protein